MRSQSKRCEFTAVAICLVVTALLWSIPYQGRPSYIHAVAVNMTVGAALAVVFWIPLVALRNLFAVNKYVGYLLVPAVFYFALFFVVAYFSPADEFRTHGVVVIAHGKVTSAGVAEILNGSINNAGLGIAYGALLLLLSKLCEVKRTRSTNARFG